MSSIAQSTDSTTLEPSATNTAKPFNFSNIFRKSRPRDEPAVEVQPVLYTAGQQTAPIPAPVPVPVPVPIPTAVPSALDGEIRTPDGATLGGPATAPTANAALDWYTFPANEVADEARFADADKLLELANLFDPTVHFPTSHVEPVLARAVELFSTKAMSQMQIEELFMNIKAAKAMMLGAVKTAYKSLQMSRHRARKALNPSYMDDLKINSNDEFVPNLHNAYLILVNDPEFAGLFAYDTFCAELAYTRKPSWSPISDGTTDADWKGKQLVDDDYSQIMIMLQAKNLNVKKDDTYAAVFRCATDNKFDSVVDYLNSVVWDGVERLPTWLHTYCKTPNDAYHSFVGTKWLIAGVARPMDPGCKVDNTLTLFSFDQGFFKTQAFQALFTMKYYGVISGDYTSKDERQKLSKKWVNDFSEGAAMSRRSANELKAFVDLRDDTFREPYGRVDTAHPRRGIFAGTSNTEASLIDETGGRRYWFGDVLAPIDVAAIARDRDQLWAEAKARYDRGEKHYETDDDVEFKALALDKVSDKTEQHPWLDAIATYLTCEGRIMDNGAFAATEAKPHPMLLCKISQILLHAIGKPTDRQTGKDSKDVGAILTRLGYKNSTIRLTDNRVVRGFKLIKPTKAFIDAVNSLALVGEVGRADMNPANVNNWGLKEAKASLAFDIDRPAPVPVPVATTAPTASNVIRLAHPVPVPVA